ncbi:MAG: hypothetical protein M1835_001379 [Candelina submexicana]|nr:MAG: hypothetical protein M1835_001379 [Candelina submexicana]
MANPEQSILATAPVSLPRVTVNFCVQCKWMLRAAYFAQELLSTFSTGLGEVALVPGTGGIFTVEITHETSTTTAANGEITTHWRNQILWDRKVEGGFPEVKELKKRVRDVIDPSRDLGHVDRTSKATSSSSSTQANANINPNTTTTTTNHFRAPANSHDNSNPIAGNPNNNNNNNLSSNSAPTLPSSNHATKSRSRSGSNALSPTAGSMIPGRAASQRTHARGGSREIAGGGGNAILGQNREMEGGRVRQGSGTGLEDEESAAAAAEVRAALGGLGG